MSNVDDTVSAWIRHFWAADREMRWTSAETELSMPLTDGVILAGRVDAIGSDWFGEWKTMSRFSKSGWQMKWRLHPQSLTYGLLLRATHPEIKRFTIRVAFKTDTPTFDHEWFSYSDGELDMWRGEVSRIAREIMSYRVCNPDIVTHWPLNPLSCYRYGSKYPCPFVSLCSHQQWGTLAGAVVVPREPHLQTERDVLASAQPDTLVLDATRISQYLECPESYRRIYTQNVVEPESEALAFGKQFHDQLGGYYGRLAAGVDNPWPYAPQFREDPNLCDLLKRSLP